MQRITFMNVETGRYYTLKYDGATVIQDKIWQRNVHGTDIPRGYRGCYFFEE